jgi:hypothetical protein
VRVPSIVLVYYTKRLHYSTRPMKPSSTYKYLIFIMFVTTLTAVYAQQNGPSCGTGDSLTTVYLEKISKQLDLTARTNAGEMLEYRLAIDVDYKTANLYGQNQAKIRNAVYNVFAETSAIFEREMNIKLTVTFIHIWQVPEPYTLDNDFDYFNKILDYWARNRHEERDAVVSLSARYGTFLGGYRMCTSPPIFQAPMSDLPSTSSRTSSGTRSGHRTRTTARGRGDRSTGAAPSKTRAKPAR